MSVKSIKNSFKITKISNKIIHTAIAFKLISAIFLSPKALEKWSTLTLNKVCQLLNYSYFCNNQNIVVFNFNYGCFSLK